MRGAAAALLLAATAGPARAGGDLDLRPLAQLTLRLALVDEYARPYSVPAAPRALAGSLSLSCEHQQGRPCGPGAGLSLELDSSAALGGWLALATRLRATAGSEGYAPALEVDRALLRVHHGPLAAQVGRDGLSLGPAVRTALLLSDHAPPLDAVRLSLDPTGLPFLPEVRVSVLWFLARLRDPQTFPGTLVDGTRLQLGFFDRLELGGTRLLQFGGEGAQDLGGFWGWVREHFHRQGDGTLSNNRLSLDVALRLPPAETARAYYELAFEDTRHAFDNALRWDTDHLAGLEIPHIDAGPLRRLAAEVVRTAHISQQHGTFLTGMTNGGRPLGAPFGPEVLSVWVSADLALGQARLSPWLEWLRLSANVYGPDAAGADIIPLAAGPREVRQRAGLNAQVALAPGWRLEVRVFGERVDGAAFQDGDVRLGAGAQAALSYAPPP